MRILLPLIIVFFSYCSIAQEKNSSITGNITNPTSNFIIIGDSTISVNSAGRFSYNVGLHKPSYFEVKYEDKVFDIYIAPSENLEIAFDRRNFERSLRFTGPSAAANYVLIDHYYTNQEVNNYFHYNWQKIFSKGEKSFIHTLDSLKRLYFRTIDAFETRKEGLNKDFVFEQKSEINLGFDRLILLYPQQHQMFTGENTSFAPESLNYLKGVPVDDPRLFEVKNYKKFTNEWVDWWVREDFLNNDSLRQSDNQWLHSSFGVITEKFKNEKVREFWLYFYLAQHIENQGVKNLEEYIKTFNELVSDRQLKDYINQYYQRELESRRGHLVKTYKTLDGIELDAHIFMPSDLKAGERRPAMVYFHGGSWSEGKPDWHFGQSDLGFISISVEYRTYGRHGVLPFEAVSDAKSFFRWLRQNAAQLQVDPNKVVASGNSAGGHLILCAAMVDTLDQTGEDLAVSPKPNFLILNSAVYDLGGVNWFDHLLKDKNLKKHISPALHIKRDLPPMLIFHGTNDRAVPFETAQDFVLKMRGAGNKIDFHPIEDAPHELWFNKKYQSTADEARKAFLRKHNVLK